MNLLRVISIVLALALGASACDDNETATTTTTEEAADAGEEEGEGAGDDGEEDEGDDAEDEGDDAEDGDASDVEVPDPCEILKAADQAAVEAVVGTISGYDGPTDRTGSFPNRRCAAEGEKFKAQLTLQAAATGYAPGSYNNENEVSGIGDGAFTFTIDEDAEGDRTLVFKEGDLAGWVNLLFAGGNLADAPEPTEEDVIAVGRAVAAAMA